MRRLAVVVLLGIAFASAIMLLTSGTQPAIADPGTTERVSVDSAGREGPHDSLDPAITADGRFVVFHSWANLAPGGTLGNSDVYVHDRQTGITERVSVDSAGTPGSHASLRAAISADGRYVAFDSYASNLVAGDTNGYNDVFVHDRQTGVTERVSVDSTGAQANHFSLSPGISADGRFVVFDSEASNLVLGDTNGCSDIFVHDRQTGVTERVSVDSTGTQSNGLSHGGVVSGDGRFIAFASYASNLVLGDTNGHRDIFVHDRQTGVTERVSVDSTGTQANHLSFPPGINADGRFVVFESYASNLVLGDTNGYADVFVHDRQTGVTERVSVDSSGNEGNNLSSTEGSRGVSGDGRFVAFHSQASNLVLGDTNICGDQNCSDVFVHDRQTGVTERVSVDSAGNQGNRPSQEGAVSGDGRYVAFASEAWNLVPDDTNGTYDIFMHDRGELPQPTPTPPSVGGIVEVRRGPSAPAAQQPGSAAPPYVALAGAAAAGALALTAGAWYARRRVS